MIAYLLFSSISLAFLLLFYRLLLEKEKRFTFNRLFLLWSLVFSFLIPMIPVGLAPVEIPWSKLYSFGETEPVQSYQNFEYLELDSQVPATATENSSASISSDTFITIAFLLYAMISILLLIRLVRIIHRIQLTISRNRTRIIHGYNVVLLNQKTIPHSFFNTVFLNKKQFENGEIPEEVLNHELAHVRQKHSLDILFVELLKAIFWFNPLLYIYKNAIAINHEYLADEAVISQGTVIKNYQHMLLNTMEKNAIPSLVSSFNFSLTKRRLQMMTQPKTKVKFLIKLTMLIPIFAGLSLMLGCEPVSKEISSESETSDELSIQILENNTLLVDETPMTLGELENLLSEMSKSPDLVRMKVSPDAKFGVVTDVQGILKKYDALRINYSTLKGNDSRELKLPPAPPKPNAPVEAQNLMQILMNSDGRILMNLIPVEVNEVRQNVKQFVENSSSDPREAVITIKTIPETPYEKYAKLLNEVRAAYQELRNAAAQKQFGTDFSNLEENSSERESIREMYPEKISIVSPEAAKQKLKNSEEAQKYKSEMDKAIQNLRNNWKEYWNIEPTQSNLAKLEKAYNHVMETHKNFGDTQTAYYNSIGQLTPPLPPIPPNPQDRIENQ